MAHYRVQGLLRPMYIDYAFLIDELARVKETEKIRVDESEMNLKKKIFV